MKDMVGNNKRQAGPTAWLVTHGAVASPRGEAAVQPELSICTKLSPRISYGYSSRKTSIYRILYICSALGYVVASCRSSLGFGHSEPGVTYLQSSSSC